MASDKPKADPKEVADFVNGPGSDGRLRDLRDRYHLGKMTQDEFVDRLGWFTNTRLQVRLADQGYWRTVWGEMVKSANDSWLRFKDASEKLVSASRAEKFSPEDTLEERQRKAKVNLQASDSKLKALGDEVLATLGLTASAWSYMEVSSAQFRKWALDLGLSPGLAAIVEAASNSAFMFFPGLGTSKVTKALASTKRGREITRYFKSGQTGKTVLPDVERKEELLAEALAAEQRYKEAQVIREGAMAGEATVRVRVPLEAAALVPDVAHDVAHSMSIGAEGNPFQAAINKFKLPDGRTIKEALTPEELRGFGALLDEAYPSISTLLESVGGKGLTGAIAAQHIEGVVAGPLRTALAEWATLDRHEQKARLTTILGGRNIDEAVLAKKLRENAPNSPLSDEELVKAFVVGRPLVNRLINSARGFITTPGDERLGLFKQAYADTHAFLTQTVNAETAGARAENIMVIAKAQSESMRTIGEVTKALYPELVAEGNTTGAWGRLAHDISGLPLADDIERLLLRTTERSGGFENAVGWYRQLLLAKPATHVANVSGNTFGLLASSLDLFMGAAASKDVKLRRALDYTEGLGLMFAHIMSGGKRGRGIPWEKVQLQFNKAEMLSHPLLPSGWLTAEDKIAQWIVQGAHVYSEGKAFLKGLQLPKGDYEKQLARWMENPPQDTMKRAMELSGKYTYNAPLWFLGEETRNLLQSRPAVLYFPFMRTLMNLGKTAQTLTPGLSSFSQQLWDDIQSGDPVRAGRAQGRITFSWMFGNFFWSLAKSGIITGGGPLDIELQRRWTEAGFKPYSYWSNGEWHDYRWADPVATPIGWMADLAQVTNSPEWSEDEDVSKALDMLGTLFARGWASSTWVQNASGLVTFISDVMQGKDAKQALTRGLASVPANIVTGGPLGTAVRDILDPEVKDIKEPLEGWSELENYIKGTVLNKFPLFSKNLPPLLDVEGEPILKMERSGGSLVGFIHPNFWSPETVSRPSKSLIKQEANRVGARLPDFERTLGNELDPVNLSPTQHFRWRDLSLNQVKVNGKSYKDLMESTINSPDYKALNPGGQAVMLESVYNTFKAAGKEVLLNEDATESAKKSVIGLRERTAIAKRDAALRRGQASMTEALIEQTNPTINQLQNPLQLPFGGGEVEIP